MKINYLLPAILFCSSFMISCGETEEGSTESNDKENVEVQDETEEVDIEPLNEYQDESIQGQWEDIVFQVGTGVKSNLDMYVSYGAEGFSEEEWGYLDFSFPEYIEAFEAYEKYEDIPDADNFAEGAKVVSVYFETESDGMIFESAVMIYMIVEEGLIWIVGCELVG